MWCGMKLPHFISLEVRFWTWEVVYLVPNNPLFFVLVENLEASLQVNSSLLTTITDSMP